MIIAVASGKGGTGKTTVATSLALVAAEQYAVRFLDCDVEAPNAALFLKPEVREHKEVGFLVPVIDERRCTYCGRCAEVCQYHAIAVIGKKTLVFPELCHGCGSCSMICPERAIAERLNVMGVLDRGQTADGFNFAQGTMNVSEPMAVPIIRELKKWAVGDTETVEVEIRDSPPVASCSVVETIRGSDYVFLVTEPTPFGLHDLKQVGEIVRELGIPAGVIVNRNGIGDGGIDDYCAENDVPILLRIPMERRIAESLGRGIPLVHALPEYRVAFRTVLESVTSTVRA